MKVLFVTAWYPTRENPINGIFIREHAKSVAIYGNEVTVIHGGRAESTFKRVYRVSDTVEDGIRAIRIDCFPSPFDLSIIFFIQWPFWLLREDYSKKDSFRKLSMLMYIQPDCQH